MASTDFVNTLLEQEKSKYVTALDKIDDEIGLQQKSILVLKNQRDLILEKINSLESHAPTPPSDPDSNQIVSGLTSLLKSANDAIKGVLNGDKTKF